MSLNIFLTYISLLLLSISLNKHYKSLFDKSINKKTMIIFRTIGYATLVITLAIFIHIKGISLGITYFIGIIAPLIIFISILFTYQSKYIIKYTLVLFLISTFFTIY
ncbi:hypothetical protein CPU12_09680 [Malaciobacter molluscorum LMG 25693]|uniref:DUF3325 domain-containing membrane protein n=1 Tax=Malaciobacter molluscorum LMG 25693 TaxID=870501 RepID=A0A2G1DGD4_9BACT|nr:DUF3325 family protein [Malaciobacter molluscorum]AXX91472.1 DUF3325 domain-containing membrane protein [Malaciobacter molluscorum LMG 25693]PHO17558.1 hypothetical protein CPU12_09680 [Malaciobacter molluscorum LMG 25693]RXJ93371.1 hypothetical protein CRV00_11350 [Malaciobacter molluscorum]